MEIRISNKLRLAAGKDDRYATGFIPIPLSLAKHTGRSARGYSHFARATDDFEKRANGVAAKTHC